MRIKLDEKLPAELTDYFRCLGHLVARLLTKDWRGQADALVADAAHGARRCLFCLD